MFARSYVRLVWAPLLVASTALLPAHAAWAAWSLLLTGAATGVGNPSCAQFSANMVACAAQGGKNTLLVNTFNGTTWGAWTRLAGTVNSDPSCTGDGDGHVLCAASAGGDFLYTIFNGTSWTAPAKVAADLYSAPSCGNFAPGTVVCVARSSTGGITWSVSSAGLTSWSAFANVATEAVSAPACTGNAGTGETAVICAFTTTGSTVLANWFLPYPGAFLNLGGKVAGTPACLSADASSYVAFCLFKSYDSSVSADAFKGGTWVAGSWLGFTSMGGTVNDNASCAIESGQASVCGAIDSNNAFYAGTWNDTTWSGFSKIGGSTYVGTPSCATLNTSQVVCVFKEINNKYMSAIGP